MLDSKRFRENIDETDQQLARRGFVLEVTRIKSLEAKRKELQTKTQELQNERNVRSKAVGQAKAAGQDITGLLAEVGKLGGDLAELEQQKRWVDIFQERKNNPELIGTAIYSCAIQSSEIIIFLLVPNS